MAKVQKSYELRIMSFRSRLTIFQVTDTILHLAHYHVNKFSIGTFIKKCIFAGTKQTTKFYKNGLQNQSGSLRSMWYLRWRMPSRSYFWRRCLFYQPWSLHRMRRLRWRLSLRSYQLRIICKDCRTKKGTNFAPFFCLIKLPYYFVIPNCFFTASVKSSELLWNANVVISKTYE